MRAQAIGIALESHRLDVVSLICKQTEDLSLLTHTIDAVVDAGFSLSYRDEVLEFLFPLFPPPTAGDRLPHIHALMWLLITSSKPSITVPFLASLIPKEKLLVLQFTFNLDDGGSQDFLESVRNQLPEVR